MNNKNRTQGFTLIELLIVIAIIGILAAVLIPNLLGAQKRAYDTGAASCAKSLQTVQATSQVDIQTYLAVGAGAGKLNGAVDGVSSVCNNTYVQVKQGATPSGTTYNLVVWDTRGSKTYTITPSDLVGTPFTGGVAPAASAFPAL